MIIRHYSKSSTNKADYTWFFHLPLTFDTKEKVPQTSFLQNSCSKQLFGKLAGRSAYVHKKNSAIDVLLGNIQKILLDASKKEQFCRKKCGAMILTYFAVSFTSAFLDVIIFLWNKKTTYTHTHTHTHTRAHALALSIYLHKTATISSIYNL